MSNSVALNFANYSPEVQPPPGGLNELKASELVTRLESFMAEIQSGLRERQLSYTEKEAAAALNMSVISLARARRGGKISYSRVAGKIHYLRVHLESYLEADQVLNSKRRR